MANEIEKMKVGLQVEQGNERLLNLRSETTESEISIVQSQLDYNKTQIDETRAESEDLYIDLRDKMSFQDDRIEEGHIDFMEVKEQTKRLLQAQDNAQTDVERLTKLRPAYADLDRQLAAAVQRFNEACETRANARVKVSNIREEINTHLDEDAEFTVDLDEVQELCTMIEDRDRRLLLDLMRVKDQIN